MNSMSNSDQHSSQQQTTDTTTATDIIGTCLPDHLVYDEILLRCPIESLINFKSVCKDWYSLVKDGDFIKQYYEYHRGNIDSMGIVLMNDTTEQPEGYVLSNFNKLGEYHVGCDVGMQANEELELTLFGTGLEYSMKLTTCNGLVCLYREFPVIMWNPVTRESIMLSKTGFEEEQEQQQEQEQEEEDEEQQQEEEDEEKFLKACGFGYDAEKDEYKVVQLLNRLSDSSLECMVLSLGTNMSWRRLQRQHNFLCPDLKRADDSPESLFADGYIYWWTYIGILCFDVTAETFKVIPSPPPQHEAINTRWYMVELNKCPCFVEEYIPGRLMDIWTMQKTYADMESLWVKGYSIDLECIYNRDFEIRPVCIQSKKIYLNCFNGLACYDTETKGFDIVIDEVSDNCAACAVAYTKRFVSLKDIVGSKCVSTAHIGECDACRGFWHIVPRNI